MNDKQQTAPFPGPQPNFLETSEKIISLPVTRREESFVLSLGACLEEICPQHTRSAVVGRIVEEKLRRMISLRYLRQLAHVGTFRWQCRHALGGGELDEERGLKPIMHQRRARNSQVDEFGLPRVKGSLDHVEKEGKGKEIKT